MKYISLGAVMEPSTEHIVKVSHCGIDYTLTQELASLWLGGRFGFAEAESPIEMRALNQLYRMGLVVTADESDAGKYRALTHCRAVPVKRKNPYAGLAGDEKTVGILICGTGIGMSMVANKHKGIRAACCDDTFSARMTRAHNNANILCFGARVIGYGLACDLVDIFLSTAFEGGRHATRVDMIMELEK